MSSGRRSSGGGQSSLGYLFGSSELGQQENDNSKVASPPVSKPPYGTDDVEESTPKKAPPPPFGIDVVEEMTPEKVPTSPATKRDGESSENEYIYRRVDGFLMTGRPSTKVKSVPGGDSSLGYLFGDK